MATRTPSLEKIPHPDVSAFDLATIMRALGDPVRLEIVRLLADGQVRLCGEIYAGPAQLHRLVSPADDARGRSHPPPRGGSAALRLAAARGPGGAVPRVGRRPQGTTSSALRPRSAAGGPPLQRDRPEPRKRKPCRRRLPGRMVDPRKARASASRARSRSICRRSAQPSRLDAPYRRRAWGDSAVLRRGPRRPSNGVSWLD